ncbi:MAG TPA: tetratricopeptide repeat protein [Candidatus Binatia bacterium]|nr:tetratricopeptide repeat protein [Candidatus Binatia bacterium]
MLALAPALALLLLAAAGIAGLWSSLPASILLILLLWLPGRVLSQRIGPFTTEEWGTGRLAVDATLSLAVLTAALLPMYVLQAPMTWMPAALSALLGVLAVVTIAGLRRSADGAALPWPLGSGSLRAIWSRLPQSPPLAEVAAFGVATGLLLPVVLRHSGGNVDDWWDLAFVQSWLTRGHFHFEEPFLATGHSHPRFLWSAWLALQALVASCTGQQPWRVQAGPLAGIVTILTISAWSALASVVFQRRRHLVAISTWMVAAWLWDTEAIPFFTRLYQDKHVSGFVLAPVLTAMTLRACAGTLGVSATGADGRFFAWRAAAAGVACAAVATVSVHSLVYTMAALCAAVAAAAWSGTAIVAWLRTRAGLAVTAALFVPALYPLAQALRLATAFGDQGISLAHADNPVVRAHLALERLLFAETAWWIVHPGAVFGVVALPAMVALLLAVRRRTPEARVLMALTLIPGALLFVPVLSSAAGALWVPWMLYRLGWMVPVPLLLAYAITGTWSATAAGRALAAAIMIVVAAMSASSATDRLRRDMAEHPFPGAPAPRGNARQVYRFLAQQRGSDPVLALSGFGELVPALAGKPVVASTERQTLVFALEESAAYARLRDRSEFFAPGTSAQRRNELADRYGARWAVLPRRLVATGSQERWLRRYGAEAYLAARAADEHLPWWSSDASGVAAGLGEGWSVALTTADWFVVHRDVAQSVASSDADARASWLQVLNAEPSLAAPLFDTPHPRTRGVLASAIGYPGGSAVLRPPPQLLTPAPQPIWLGGGEPWEDIPAHATVGLSMDVPCRIDALRLVPYIPRLRREALEVRVGDQVVRRQALHDVPIDVAIGGEPRSHVEVHVRSLIGNLVTLSDIELMGDPASCTSPWSASAKAAPMVPQPSSADLLALAAAHPHNARPLLSLAHRADDEDRDGAAFALLDEATRRDPALAAGWIELGFSLDSRDRADDAIASFARAVAADSRSAWAHGCLAWAHVRRGSVVPALWHALRARSLDPYYADSWTLVAYVLHAARADGLAERALDLARRTDRERNWPYLARAEFAMARGDVDTARSVLREYLEHMPLDSEARARLAAIDEKARQGAERRAGSEEAAKDAQ